MSQNRSQFIVNFINELVGWRDERGLTMDMQQAGLLRNLMEELGEYAAGIKIEADTKALDNAALVTKYDGVIDGITVLNARAKVYEHAIFEQCDAICDILVFAFNSVEPSTVIEREHDSILNNYDVVSQTVIRSSMLLDQFVQATMLLRLSIKLGNYSSVSFYLASLVDLADRLLGQLGIDLERAMAETLKEIHSRKGHWSEELKKFVKDTSYPTYKADYTSALIKKIH